MRKMIIFSLIALTLCVSSCGNSNKPVTSDNSGNEYYTQTNMSALEYSMYIANKISVATGQLNTHMAKIRNVANGSCTYEDEISAIESSIKILKEDKIDLNYVYPPDSYSSTRDNALQYWQDAIDKLSEISDELSDDDITTERATELSSDLSDIFTSIQSLNFVV